MKAKNNVFLLLLLLSVASRKKVNLHAKLFSPRTVETIMFELIFSSDFYREKITQSNVKKAVAATAVLEVL